MDLGGTVDTMPGFVIYASQVRDCSRETVEKFNDRVRCFAEKNNIKLGEGRFKAEPNQNYGVVGGFILEIVAPLSEGSWEQINTEVFHPTDESCVLIQDAIDKLSGTGKVD